MKKSIYMLFAIVFAMMIVLAHSAQAAYFDKTLTTPKVQLRIYYKSPAPAICDAIILGVGTFMTRADYDNLAMQLIPYGYVVVIMDHNPGNMVKTDATKYKNCALAVQAGLVSWLAGTGCTEINYWILGGHSAGGQAAQNAIANNTGLADAIFSIDPFDCSSAGNVNVPALYWGYNETTCSVTKEKAARAAYYKSLGERAFYRVKKVTVSCGTKFKHCTFADSGCTFCTNCQTTPTSFYVDVAATVNKFINAAFYGTWSKANLTVVTTTAVDFFVDSDAP